MATNNSVNNRLSSQTGTGSFVGGTAPTITLPFINNTLDGYTSTATAAGTTVLDVNSTYRQTFTGTSNQIVTMPVTSTLTQGQAYTIINTSTGTITVNSSGGNLIVSVGPSTSALVVCILTSGTTAASWYTNYSGQYIQTLGINFDFLLMGG
ncbi:MAG: hypothetical protein KA318_00030 [Nitrosomonas sp.]|nr:hypothetical protein [Nitrosomonas sp.]